MLPPYRAPLDSPRPDRLRLALVLALPLAFVCFTAASFLSSRLELKSIPATLLSAYALRFGNDDLQQLREPSPLWSEEENDLRSYRWQAPEVDKSLQAFVEGLDGVSGHLQRNVAALAELSRRRLNAELETGCSRLAR